MQNRGSDPYFPMQIPDPLKNDADPQHCHFELFRLFPEAEKERELEPELEVDDPIPNEEEVFREIMAGRMRQKLQGTSEVSKNSNIERVSTTFLNIKATYFKVQILFLLRVQFLFSLNDYLTYS